MPNMNTEAVRATAKIYQFPLRGRAGVEENRLDTRKGPIVSGLRPVNIGAAWYHEAAIQEERERRG
jgi:hypothetical protein